MKTITFETTIENGTITLPADYKFEGEVKILISEIEHIKNNFDKQIEDNQIDNDDLLEKARSSAWESYQNYFLKDVAVD